MRKQKSIKNTGFYFWFEFRLLWKERENDISRGGNYIWRRHIFFLFVVWVSTVLYTRIVWSFSFNLKIYIDTDTNYNFSKLDMQL
jgi:hypothetical protein